MEVQRRIELEYSINLTETKGHTDSRVKRRNGNFCCLIDLLEPKESFGFLKEYNVFFRKNSDSRRKYLSF